MNKEFCKIYFEMWHEMEDVTKNAKGYGYTYANLEKIMDTIKPVLHKHGCCLSHHTELSEANHITITTDLIHKEHGVVLTNTKTMPFTPNADAGKAAQDYGKISTYLRRYSINELFALSVVDEDTDANIPKAKPKYEVKDQIYMGHDKQKIFVMQQLKSAGVSAEEYGKLISDKLQGKPIKDLANVITNVTGQKVR